MHQVLLQIQRYLKLLLPPDFLRLHKDFTKGCFVPDKPYNDNCCNCPENDGRESIDFWNYHIRNGRLDRSEGNTFCRISYQTKNDKHVCHGRYKRMHLEFRCKNPAILVKNVHNTIHATSARMTLAGVGTFVKSRCVRTHHLYLHPDA